MTFMQTLWAAIQGLLPAMLWFWLLPMIPFIVAEQLKPVGRAPRVRDYGMNVLIGLSTAVLALPLGMVAGIWSAKLREYLPWDPISFSFSSIGTLPVLGGALEIAAMILVPLVIHDFWFYWAHRLEHKVPALWAFHRIHHSDECMNAATSGRDQFMQSVWRSFFSIFTLGLFVDLSLQEAGKAAFYSTMFLMCLSMFYHSAIRVHVSALDAILVTPQVHRLHHSTDPAHYNKNFADALPIFDILFGTFHRPARNEFPPTGLADFPEPRNLWSAQVHPVLAAMRMCLPRTAKTRVGK